MSRQTTQPDFLQPYPASPSMIVCICNNVSDRRIRQAVDSGMKTMTEIRHHLDVGTACGRCHACAKAVLRECAENAKAQPLFLRPGAMAA